MYAVGGLLLVVSVNKGILYEPHFHLHAPAGLRPRACFVSAEKATLLSSMEKPGDVYTVLWPDVWRPAQAPSIECSCTWLRFLSRLCRLCDVDQYHRTCRQERDHRTSSCSIL